jgi:hypothetical protein
MATRVIPDSMEYGGQTVTPGWRYVSWSDPSGTSRHFWYNPQNPSQYFVVKARDAVGEDLYSVATKGKPRGYDPRASASDVPTLFRDLGNGRAEPLVDVTDVGRKEELRQQELLNEQVRSGLITGTQAANAANAPRDLYRSTFEEASDGPTPASERRGRETGRVVNVGGTNYREGSPAYERAVALQGGRGIDYAVRPGETTAAYNARIASERAASSGTGSGGTGGAGSGVDLSSLSPSEREIYSQMEAYLSRLEAAGKAINPNIQIDERQVAKFLKQAEAEIDPYYATQLKLAREQLLRSIGYGAEELERAEREDELAYQESVRTSAAANAERGFAQSGVRQREERELADVTNRGIQDRRRSLSFQAGNQARQFAQQFGAPPAGYSLSATPTAAAGEMSFSRTGAAKPVYQLSDTLYDGLVGQQEYQRRADVKTRASQLEQAFRGTLANQQTRKLTL